MHVEAVDIELVEQGTTDPDEASFPGTPHPCPLRSFRRVPAGYSLAASCAGLQHSGAVP